MAKCDYCHKDMLKSNGCILNPIPLKRKLWRPIPYEIPEEFKDEVAPDERCHDCGARPGHFHHPGCDVERCPACGHQLISCGCLDETEEDLKGDLVKLFANCPQA